MSNLQQLDEALDYLNDNSIIEESFLGILKKLFTNKKKEKIKVPDKMYDVEFKEIPIGTTKSFLIARSSVVEEIKSVICSIMKAYCDYGNLKINKKSEKDLDEIIYVYECNNVKYSESNKKYTCRVNNKLFEGTVKDALSKYNIKYEIIDTSSLEAERKSMYNKVIKICKDSYKAVQAKGYNITGVKVCDEKYMKSNYDEDENPLDEFLEGLDNAFPCLDYDAWEGTGQRARDEELYNKWGEAFDELFKEVSSRIKSDSTIKGAIECTGDWDGGTIDFYIIK